VPSAGKRPRTRVTLSGGLGSGRKAPAKVEAGEVRLSIALSTKITILGVNSEEVIILAYGLNVSLISWGTHS
jgi:hypothetical protein